MADKSEIGARMKNNYENVAKTKLVRRMPVAIRVDGKAFHTYTKNMQKPFDMILVDVMQKTMKFMCENIQGCVLGYTQSDEITLILIDYQNLDTSAWFDYEVQKVASVSASMATIGFRDAMEDVFNAKRFFGKLDNAEYEKYMLNSAMFDARCFNIPKEEVTNLLYWRELDAIRNSIEACGQAHFTQRELNGKNRGEIKEMLKTKGFVWEELPVMLQRGSCCIRGTDRKWMIDKEIPLFAGSDYVDKLIFI